jgi:hypothetical protein
MRKNVGIFFCFLFPYEDDIKESLRDNSRIIELFNKTGIQAASEVAIQLKKFISFNEDALVQDLINKGRIGKESNIRIVIDPEDDFFSTDLMDALKLHGFSINRLVNRDFYNGRGRDLAPAILAELIREHKKRLKKLKSLAPRMIERRLFMSYVSEDADIVRQFAINLRSLGVDTWLDEENIVNHDNWIEEIYEALDTCCGFVQFRSATFSESRVAQAEFSYWIELINA